MPGTRFWIRSDIELPVDLAYTEGSQAFFEFGAFPGLQIKPVCVQRANDLAGAHQTFSERSPQMGTSVLDSKDASIPLPKYGRLEW